MKINIKSILVGLIIGVIITSSVFADMQTIQAFYNNIKISLNGTVIDLKDVNGNTVEPFIYNGTTYLPVRAVAEALGMEVKYNETTNTVELTSLNSTIASSTINSLPKVSTTSDGIATTPLDDNGEYSENSKLYVDTYRIIKKYQDKFNEFNEKTGYNFNIIKIDEQNFKLVLFKNNQIILDNIPTFPDYGYNYIPLDYYENNILPILK